jgi:signal transduction histidine kinase
MIRRKSIVLLSIVCFIAVLLLLNFFAIKRNSLIIDENKKALEEAAQIRVSISEVLSNIHLLDLGLRGIALVDNKQIESSMDSAFRRKDRLYHQLENPLLKQGFSTSRLLKLKDTINQYFDWANKIRLTIKTDTRQKAIEMINEDRGYSVWFYHQQLSKEINQFEDAVEIHASNEYQSALRYSYFLQGVLILLIIPTLIYLAYSTIQSFLLSAKLLQSEAEKNSLLQNQNKVLEQMVDERTKEIAAQNEDILSQNEEIHAHNEKLVAQQIEIEKQSTLLQARNKQLEEATGVISRQKAIIEKENMQLSSELVIQNKELRATNYELIQKTTRIEQFAYMISHNLRGPIARLSGLTNIFKLAHSKEELDSLVNKTMQSASELDQVVKDLSAIMQIQRLSTDVFVEINLKNTLQKMKRVFENEIKETGTQINSQFEVTSIYSLPAYVDNIFYNLISNSIKYRHPQRTPEIILSSVQDGNYIKLEFSDNGLGFDTINHNENIFGLYKRFHFHVDGRGMGLYLIKTQIDMLNGKIEVKSEINKGTTFVIFLPLQKN